MSKTYVVDIDGTICDWQAGRDYTLAEPFPEKIKVINKLYDEGNTLFLLSRNTGPSNSLTNSHIFCVVRNPLS